MLNVNYKIKDIIQAIIIIGIVCVIEIFTHNRLYIVIWLLVSDIVLGAKALITYSKKIIDRDNNLVVKKNDLFIYIIFAVVLLLMLNIFTEYGK